MQKRRFKKRRIVLALLLFLMLVALVLFGAKVYLMANLILGNDVLIKLSADNENIFLVHGESQNLSIKTDIFTNPFCPVNCDFNFIDLSTGEIIEKSNFSLKTIKPVTKDYVLTPPLKYTGQKLYRFDISCSSNTTFLCRTTEEIKKRNILITLNYDLNEAEKQANLGTKSNIVDYTQRVNLLISALIKYRAAIAKMHKTLNLEDTITEYGNLMGSAVHLNKSLQNITVIWQDQDYSLLEPEIKVYNNSLNLVENNLTQFNIAISKIILNYNFLVENISYTQNKLLEFQEINVSNETLNNIDETINKFNLFSVNFSNVTISDKMIQILIIEEDINLINQEIKNSTNASTAYVSNYPINYLNLTKIDPIDLSFNTSIITFLKEQEDICCFNNKCQSCCNDSCYSDKTKFPIIFIHGHDFSKLVSAEYNLNIFDEMQRALEKDGYIDAGSFLIGSDNESLNGVLGKTNYPVTVRASYYFDSYKDRDQNIILQTKQDSLDTYAIRLNDIVNSVKLRTNKEKVIIISHSMGGLVARRYLQIFGDSSVDKLIMIGSPNHGINGSVYTYCSLFGAKLECDDMGQDSLFLNKLSNAKKPTIPLYSIIGIGCDTGGETGDSVVKSSSAYLSYAKNYFVNGTCKETNFNSLHTKLVDPNRNPEVYKIVRNILKSE